MSLNRAMLIGRVGKNPEIKQISDTRKAAQFSLATTEKYKDRNGETKENTEWHNIVAFDKTAELVERYVTSGMQLYIEGKLRTRSWEDRDGNKRYVTEILVGNIQFLESRKEEKHVPAPAQQKPKSAPLPPAGDDDDSDLPF